MRVTAARDVCSAGSPASAARCGRVVAGVGGLEARLARGGARGVQRV